MKTVIVIPARYASTRFPGKPLANIAGKSLLERVWRIAKAVVEAEQIIIATDDERIVEHAQSFGATVQITSSNCINGSERILECLQSRNLSPDIVVNLQGDAVLTPPFVISKLIKEFSKKENDQFALATPCVQLTVEQYKNILEERNKGITGGTMVTFDQDGRALYFSRAIIPFIRDFKAIDKADQYVPAYRHIGLYAFRLNALKEYVKLKPTKLEIAEGLEQLRVLEHGMAIKVIPVDYQGRTHGSIDHPEDIAVVESIIEKEKELVF